MFENWLTSILFMLKDRRHLRRAYLIKKIALGLYLPSRYDNTASKDRPRPPHREQLRCKAYKEETQALRKLIQLMYSQV